MIEIRTELAEIIRFEQPLARRRLPAVHSDQVHGCFIQDYKRFLGSETTFRSDDDKAILSSCELW